ncbi:MAG TPA: hypothetical protein VKG23_13720, partial [Thermoanaerobaculia bacterium]|nr:hypothetical protein [Thermoanaerobaculia bacterium]
LCREAVERWTEAGWIVLAPNQPTVALAGPDFVPEIGLRVFCGETADDEDDGPPSGPSAPEEEFRDDEHS